MGLKSAGSRIRIKDIETVPLGGRSGMRSFTAGTDTTPSSRAANEEDGRTQDASVDAFPATDRATPATTGGMAMKTEPIGQALRNARISAGMELSDVAAHLRIRTNFLAALEDGKADALPGVTYAIGYVRTYSAFLDLDPDDAVRRFKQEAAGLQAPAQLSFPSPAPEGKVPGAGVMVAAAVLATLAYGGWYVLSERGMTLDDIVPAVPERLAELINSDPALAPQESTGASSAENSITAPPVSTYAQANPDGSAAIDRRATSEIQAPLAGPADTPAAAPTNDAPAFAQPASTQDIPPAPIAIEPRRASDTSGPAEDMPQVARAPIPPVAVTPEAADTATMETAPAETPGSPSPASTDAGVTVTADASVEPAPVEPSAAAPAAPSEQIAARPSSLVASSEAAVPTAPEIPAAPGVSTTAPAVPDTGVVVRASGDSWVQIKDPSGNTLFTRVLSEGDFYQVPNQRGLTLDTGNAGTLDILVDGTAIPTLGDFGDVVRNISLDPAALKRRTEAENVQTPTVAAPTPDRATASQPVP